MRRRWLVTLMVAVVLSASCSGDDDDRKTADRPSSSTSTEPAAAPRVEPAAVSGPVQGGVHGFPQTQAVLDLAAVGYVEEEFFLTGTASSYSTSGTWGSDGKWTVGPDTQADYVTRALVRRPENADDFNGTVVVEWFNVSSSVDVDVDFGYLGPEIVREGYGWVGVSAQAAGVNSTGGSSFGDVAIGLKAWDPERYGGLNHPGDAYSYDIFSQAGAAVRAPESPLSGGLEVEHVIADGESQSAFRMLTYVNAVHPVAGVYDGFLIHSRSGTGAPLGDGMTGGVPSPAQVRTDQDAPVLQFETETDLFGLGAGVEGADFPSARQPDSDTVATWEVAGTAHADAPYLSILLQQGRTQFGSFLDLTGVIPIANHGPQTEVMRAALHALRSWVRAGTTPPAGEPLEEDGKKIVRDEHGIALGGVRPPAVDVPVEVNSGEGASLIGSRTTFTPEELSARYASHAAYVDAVERSARAAQKAGFLLAYDADAIITAAEESTVGR